MPAVEVLLCDYQPCDKRPVARYLVSAPFATHEVLLCPEHRHNLMDAAARGRIIGTPARGERDKLDELWTEGDG